MDTIDGVYVAPWLQLGPLRDELRDELKRKPEDFVKLYSSPRLCGALLHVSVILFSSRHHMHVYAHL